MDIFEYRLRQTIQTQAPLADRMRPRTLDEFIGQEHIIGAGRLLRRAILADRLSSVIFFGPPGTGKTTLAKIIAKTTKAHFIAINAVLAGIKDIREAVSTATNKLKLFEQRTILFIDEVHRFNKSQQDALLPWVENGTVILIGATTENPYFEVNKALVSRSRIFQLKSLEEQDLSQIVQQALSDCVRGYGQLSIDIKPLALSHLVNVANGDARSLLNALELAVESTSPNKKGVIEITLAVAEESIQRRAILYDKEGDAHFDTISALIKSIRGSDPDAALYWLARMVYAGEDPRFIFRRLLIAASEDIGLAEPNAVAVVNACAEAFDRVGMPEGRYHLAQATLYLATVPKSNSVMGFFEALEAIERERKAQIPNHLKDAHRDSQGFGHGSGYLYPHAYREHWVAQQYLPRSLQGVVFYQPSDRGQEREIKTQVARRREAQLAAWQETKDDPSGEILTYGKTDKKLEQWLERTLSQEGKKLEKIRESIFSLAQPQRHHVVLDLNAASGLLTWEALRLVPEGGVYARVRHSNEAEFLLDQITALPEIMRPVILTTTLANLSEVLTTQIPGGKFDCIIGRNALLEEIDKVKIVESLTQWLSSEGKLVLAETIPRQGQRLYKLVDSNKLEPTLYQRWIMAEEAIYSSPSDPMSNWDAKELRLAFEQVGLEVNLKQEQFLTPLCITSKLLQRWFGSTVSSLGRPSYAARLKENLSEAEIVALKEIFSRDLTNQTVNWLSTIVFIEGQPSSR